MSARSGITKAMAEKIKTDIVGNAPYVVNLHGNVSSKTKHWNDIDEYPYVTVTPGPEYREDMPSHFTMSELNVFIRVFVENEEDATGELEEIISDLETFVDTNLNLSYNVNTPQGLETRNTITNSILSITTDEGILEPNAVGEIALNVKYEKQRL